MMGVDGRGEVGEEKGSTETKEKVWIFRLAQKQFCYQGALFNLIRFGSIYFLLGAQTGGEKERGEKERREKERRQDGKAHIGMHASSGCVTKTGKKKPNIHFSIIFTFIRSLWFPPFSLSSSITRLVEVADAARVAVVVDLVGRQVTISVVT